MLFPVVVHKEPRSAFGVTIPDIPGCFTAGATLDEALRNVQEAVELYFEGEDLGAPIPSPIDAWAKRPEFSDGLFALVDIDLGFLDDTTVRVNITARRSALAAIDRAAKAHGEDRSAFLVRSALERATNTASSGKVAYAAKPIRSLGKSRRAR